MDLDRPLRNRKAESRTPTIARPRLVHAEEAIENSRPMLSGDAGALVGDLADAANHRQRRAQLM